MSEEVSEYHVKSDKDEAQWTLREYIEEKCISV